MVVSGIHRDEGPFRGYLERVACSSLRRRRSWLGSIVLEGSIFPSFQEMQDGDPFPTESPLGLWRFKKRGVSSPLSPTLSWNDSSRPASHAGRSNGNALPELARTGPCCPDLG